MSSLIDQQIKTIMANTNGKPRLTYSSVIHSLVEQLTKRSPFLQQEDEGDGDVDVDNRNNNIGKDNVLFLDRSEVQIGRLLGQGNFSNVFEVVGFRLERQLLDQHERFITQMEDKQQDMNCSPLSNDQRWPINSDNVLRRYAMKCLKPELLSGPTPNAFLEAATDLVIEAKYLSKLNHPNILKLRGIARGWEYAFANGEYDSFFLLVDRLEETLSTRIRRWKKGEFPRENTLERKLHIALQIASALAYMHERRLILRDIKPNNIGIKMFPHSDEIELVQLFDFGFCRELPVVEQSRDDIEATNEVSRISTLASGETVFLMSGKGTRRYMAPECLLENRYNQKADVYSFSMVTWEMLTLHKPFQKYSKEQHTLFVCKGGDRPPLEPFSETLWKPASTILSAQSTSFSSLQNSISSGEEPIDFEQFMSDPVRELLRHAWDQDVSQRYTMKKVCQSLQGIIDSQPDGEERNPSAATSSSDLSNSTHRRGFSCLSSMTEYGEMRDIVMEFASEMQELPFLTCFGHESSPEKENAKLEQVSVLTIIKQAEEPSNDVGPDQKIPPKVSEKVQLPGNDGEEHKVFSYRLPLLRALLAQ